MKLDFVIEKIKKLFAVKGFGAVVIGVAAGLLLMLLPGDSSAEPNIENVSAISSYEYCTLLERKAESLITELPGVDDCSVFITLESGFRYIYATDQHVREDGNGKQTDKTIVLAANDSGEEAILVEENMPKIAGVAVVCGGASYETQYRIIELMCALFDIDSHRINVQT